MWFKELRYAGRRLRASPGFALAAIGTLSLGIALNTLVFTVLYSLLWRPLPVRDAESLVRIFPTDAYGRRQNLVRRDRLRLLASAPGLTGITAYRPLEATLAEGDGVRSTLAYAVSSTYFQLLGIDLTRGRPFVEDEAADAGRGRLAIISYGMWTRHFERAEDAIGRRVVLNGMPFTIVGVGPRKFSGTEPLDPDIWVPLSAQQILEPGELSPVLVIGRLAPGSSPRVVREALSATLPHADRDREHFAVAPATFFSAGQELRPVILLVMTVVALVLVIASANVANLVLARATGRAREVAVRRALGASAGRLAAHLISESLLVASASGVVGLLLSAWTLRALYPVALSLLPFTWASVVLDLSPDVRVFGYTVLIAASAAAVCGLSPMLQWWTEDVTAALRDQHVMIGTSLRGSRLRQSFVAVQVAVCVMLLAAAAVAARALERTKSLDVGLTPAGVVHTSADLERQRYAPAAAADFYRRLSERAWQLPGVTDVALTTHVPLTGGVRRVAIRAEGHSGTAAATYTAASPEYFRVLNVAVVDGRTFSATEAATGAPVAVISEALARRFWAGDRGVGKRVFVEGASVPATVIGVVRDAADSAIWLEKEISVYVPANPASALNLRLLVKTTQDPHDLAHELRREAHAVDPRLHFEAITMSNVLAMWILPSRVARAAAFILASLALVLAAVGLYGVMTFAVSQRRRELGVRIALGASSRDVTALVLGQGGRVVGAGIAAGVAGATILMRAIARFLPGAAADDWVAVGVASAVLGLTALVACYLPARSAAVTDPIAALKAD